MPTGLDSIHTRLRLGFASVVALFGIVVVVGIAAETRQQTAATSQGWALADLQVAGAVERGVAVARERLSAYRATASAADHSGFLAEIAALHALAPALRGLPDQRSLPQAAEAARDAVAAGHMAVAQMNGALGSLSAPVAELVDLAGRSGHAPMIDQALRLQGAHAAVALAVGRFSVAEERRNALLLNESVLRLRARTEEIDHQTTGNGSHMVAAEASSAVEAVVAAHARLDGAVTARGAGVSELERMLSAFEAAAGQLRIAAVAEHAAAAQAVQTASAGLIQIALACLAAAMGIGAAMVLWIGHGTVKPLRRLAGHLSAMATQSAGAAPGLGRRDEIGALARAAEAVRLARPVPRADPVAADAALRQAQQDLAGKIGRQMEAAGSLHAA